MSKKNKRFKVILSESTMLGASKSKILKDVETGVLYLFHEEGGFAGGLTPLLGRDGKPLIEAGCKEY